MTRRVSLLMGVAILAVVVTHAASRGQLALIEWRAAYSSVAISEAELLDTPTYWLLSVIRQLTSFAVPAFLFCAGFFVSYAARGPKGRFTWKMVRARLTDMLIPYLIWSLVWFALDALDGGVYPPLEYVSRLLTGQADGGSYYFIPLVCQFYLLSPLVVPLAKSRPRLLLAVAAVFQIINLALVYLYSFGTQIPAAISWTTNVWLIFPWTVFFALGLVCGLHFERFKPWLVRSKRLLVGALIVLAVAGILEPEALLRTTGHDARNIPVAISTALYSIVFLLVFIAFERISLPRSNDVTKLGNRSYGIYLTHLKAMEYVTRIIHVALPALLAYQVVIIFPLALIVGLAAPWVAMSLMIKLPVRKYYRYLFG
ncbi:MAG: acyltransferase [Chloroflexi bacterium]|nr:acyltransferase [Chloroflexota bacterium]